MRSTSQARSHRVENHPRSVEIRSGNRRSKGTTTLRSEMSSLAEVVFPRFCAAWVKCEIY